MLSSTLIFECPRLVVTDKVYQNRPSIVADGKTYTLNDLWRCGWRVPEDILDCSVYRWGSLSQKSVTFTQDVASRLDITKYRKRLLRTSPASNSRKRCVLPPSSNSQSTIGPAKFKASSGVGGGKTFLRGVHICASHRVEGAVVVSVLSSK